MIVPILDVDALLLVNEKLITPLPLPLLPLVMVINVLLLTAVQGQSAPVVMVKLLAPADELTPSLVGESE